MLFTFCQNGHCCSTGELPAQDKNCHQNNYTDEIGDCAKFDFVSDSMQGIEHNKEVISGIYLKVGSTEDENR